MATNVETLIEAAKNLSAEEREQLLQALRTSHDKPKRRITEIRGLGKEIWQNTDAQDYVTTERDSWEN